MKTKLIKISVSFPLASNWVKTDDLIEKTAKKFGGKDAGSGAGMGMRDAEYEFSSAKDAKAAKKAIKELNIEGLEFYD